MEHPKHIVAVMGIVRNSEGQILLVRTPRRGWEPPGGQVENGEDVLTDNEGIIYRVYGTNPYKLLQTVIF
jgi:8-oxo-dGTP pyrophosphatase MutT (NUDIX family)